MVGRFTSVDPVKDGLNWYAYCAGNPVTFVDSNGLWIETAWDAASWFASLCDVVNEPKSFWNWAGLIGDTVDFIPFLTGVGETIKVLKYSDEVIDIADGIIDTTDTIHDLSNAVDAIGDTAETFHGISKTAETIEDVAKTADDVARKTDFYVTPDGVAFPASKAEFDNNLAKMELRDGKYYGVDSNGNEIRVRVEQHDPKPDFKGPPSPYHEKPHFHFDRKKNITTGKWITTYTGGIEMLHK